jgi:ADP-heptose:LPS heptosyltransferase
LLTGSLPFPEKGKRPHRVECYLELLRLAVTAPIFDKTLSLTIPAEITVGVTGVMAERGADQSLPYVAMAPGAAQPNKMWIPERFAELARRLLDDNTPVVLVGGPAERELAVRVVELSGRDDIVNLVGTGSLLHTAEIIRRAAVFVGNDSGLAHVAAAVDTRSVILSGPGDQTEVAPYSDKAVTIAKEVFCKPCYKNYCWRQDKPLECLELIAVDEVFTEVSHQLMERQSGFSARGGPE